MADDIFGNMSNMSIDELGSSLLQRKAEQEREAAKKAKKNERIQQGLALLLMGQGIMKTQYKKRMKELEDFHKFETLNNEHKVKQLNMNATILNTIGNTWDGKGGLDGFKNSDDYIRFSKEVRPFVDQKIKAMTADEYDTIYGTSTYENAMNLATESYANKYLETDTKSGKANYLAYQDGLRELLGDEAIDLDKNELFQRAMGLSVDELTGYQRKNYQNVLAQYKAQGNLMGGFKRVLGLFNDDFKAKGGFDIFSKVTEDALAGPTIRDLNQAMNLKGMTNNIVSKALADASKSDTRWRERARGKRFENYRKNIGELYLPQMTNLIEEGRYPSELETDTFIGKGNWEEFMSDISAGDKENLILDTAALSLRLKEDRRFLEAVYNETEGKKADGRSFNEFRAILDDEANRSMFAAMIVTDAGFRDESWNPFNWKDETYNSFGTLTKIYNRYNVSTMIGDDIKVNERGSVSLPESYIEASKERKQDMLKSTVRDILKTSKTENERNVKLSGELDSEINKYFGMDSQAFIEMLAQEEMKGGETKISLEQEIQERYLTPKQKEIYRMNLQNIKNLEDDIKNNVVSSRDFTGKSKQEEASPRDIKIMQNKIERIKNSNLELLESGRGGIDLKNQISRKETELQNLKDRLPLLQENLSPTRFESQLEKVNILETEIEELKKEYNQIGISEETDEKKKTRPSYINDEVLNLQRIHLEEKNKDGTSRFTYTNIEEAQDTLNELTEFVLEAESDGDFNAANPNSSARGGYQFTKDASQTAMNRVESKMGKKIDRFDEVRQTGDVRNLSESDQTLLFIGDILEKSGSDKYIQNLLDAKTPKEKRNAAYQIYSILHHTLDSKGKIPKIAELQTKRKLRKYFNE
jgi:hypothetical protein